LIGILYLSIIITILLSVAAQKNIGQNGFDKCIEKQCEKGEEHCNKYRTINNCCVGAGGDVGVSNNKYVCIFN